MRFTLSSLFLASLALATSACTPAHRPANGDGGIGPDSGRPTICGDLFVNIDVDEQCDDGNTDDGDGCDSNCKFEIPELCGNNVIDEGEACDDGNNEGGDGCGPGCWIEGCGNQYLDPGEACEDNNTVGGDGCSADCKSNETCGNGIKDPDEGCDDGDGDDGDQCPATCEAATCGDGFVHLGVESCDDGNDVEGDGCTECILDSCGDAMPDPGEECDLGAGNGLNGTTCFKNCLSTELETDAITTMALDPHSDLGVRANYVEAADFNGDGKADVLLGDSNASGTSSVVYGLGDGRLWPAIHNFSLSGSFRNLALADVNGDGNPDVLAVTSSDSLLVMLGNGVGFEQATFFTTILDIGGSAPFDLVVAELTGDSHLDVATANTTSNDVVIMAGDGAGGFTATTRLAVSVGENGVAPRSIAVGDVTGDGRVDIVTANTNSDDVTLFAGLGSGQYSAGQIFTTRVGAGGEVPADIVITDVTNDGIADVLVGCTTSDDVVVLASSGGSLAAPQRFTTLAGGGGDSPLRIFVADVTQDGIKDILTANSGTSDVSLLRGLGPGVAFGPPTILSTLLPDGATSTGTRDVRAGDVNGDNVIDIVTVNSGSRDATVFLGQGGGDFSAPRAFRGQTDFDPGGPTMLVLGDINGDSDLDILSANSGAMTALAGLGDGRFAGSQIHSGFVGKTVAAGDLNGDGLLDYVLPLSQSVGVRLQTPNGEFTSLSAFSSSTPISVDIGEFTGDASLDVAAITTNTTIFLTNNGTGTLTAGPTGSAGSGLEQCVLGDVTGDNELDMVMPSSSSNGVFIGTGTGTGSFSSPVSVSTSAGSSGLSPASAVVHDLNGDGLNDIVTANRDTNDLSVLIGEGSGTFAAPQIVPTVFGADPASVESVAVGDFNNDGKPDLAAVNSDRDTVSLMLGFGDGLFAAPQTYPVAGRPFSISVADFDGDGIDDVVVVSTDAGTVTTLTGFTHP